MSHDSDIHFRPCIADDVEQAVPLILSSGPDAFRYVFQNKHHSPGEFLHYAFVRKGGEFGYGNHYALLQQDRIVGIGSIFDGSKAQGFMVKDFFNIINFYGLSCFGVVARGLRAERIIPPPRSSEVCIGHLGIDPTVQSQGLGTKLIELLKQQCPLKSGQHYMLDVSEENPRAKALYERLGFQVTKHRTSNYRNEYGHVPGHFRMVL